MKAFISLFLYRILWFVLLPIALLLLLLRSKTQAAYRKRLSERLGFAPKSFKQRGIMLHAASVGEIMALRPFIDALLSRYPEIPLTVTTFTPTGSEQVTSLYGDRVQHCYLPLDNILTHTLFFARLKPQLCLFMETEIWPSMLVQLKRKGTKLMLINGRLTEKSIGPYNKLSGIFSPAIAAFDVIETQSQFAKEHFIALGANPDTTECIGNLKYDLSVSEKVVSKTKELGRLLGEREHVWMVASTHPGDEAIALHVLQQLKQKLPSVLLVLVPRHPERFSNVANLCVQAGFATVKRSENTNVVAEHDVWLIDSLGELMALFPHADVVTMGEALAILKVIIRLNLLTISERLLLALA